MPTREIPIGELVLIPHRELVRAGERLPLGGRALAVLSTLAEAGGALVTKDELFDAVWKGLAVEDNALQAQVSQLRRVLGAESGRLVAAHGRGYRLDLGEADPSIPEASVAVLPFDNFTGDPDNAYLADGIAEEVIGALSRVPELKVPARTSSFAYRGREVDIRTIARELGVAHVLAGSVRLAGKRLRVSAQLVAAESGYHLLARNFDHELDDLLVAQEKLAESIAEALKPGLRMDPAPARSPEALALVLRSRAMISRVSADAVEAAAALAEEAIRIDPDFAAAWQARADALHSGVAIGAFPVDRRREVLSSAMQASRLDPQLPYPRALQGALSAFAGHWLEAEEHFAAAFALHAKTPVVAEHYALYHLLPLGYLNRAREMAEAAIKMAPARARAHQILGNCHGLADRHEQAIAAMETARLLGFPATRPPYLLAHASHAEANRDYETAARLTSELVARELADEAARSIIEQAVLAIPHSSRREQICSELWDLLARNDRRETLWHYAAMPSVLMHLFVQLGDFDRAFAILERIEQRWRETENLSTFAFNSLWQWSFRQFRREPRFQDYAARFGMVSYWEQHGPPDGHDLRGGKLICS